MAKSVLFVCLGNICRSPAAEGVLKKRVADRRLDGAIRVDSAGTTAYHVGELPDARMRDAGSCRGYTFDSRARAFTPRDLERFDLIVPMDRDNQQDILAAATTRAQRGRVQLLSAFLSDGFPPDVPDPYYGGAAGFERVLDMVETAADPIIEHLLREPGDR